MNKSYRGADAPKTIENLGTGSFYLNFNVIKKVEKDINTKKEIVTHEYNQVRCDYPISKEKEDIIKVIKEQLKECNFELTKELNEYINKNV